MQDESERGLLFGVIALRENFIDRATFNEALLAWAREGARGLEQILLERGVLSPEQSQVVECKLARQLAQAGADAGGPETEVEPGEGAPADGSLTTYRDPCLTTTWKGEVTVDDEPSDDPASAPAATQADTRDAPAFTPARSSPDMRYHILNLLALGGLGEVYVARDKELNRHVALKLIQERCARDEPSRARFLFEAGITSALEHPGIAPVHGHGLLPDGRPYYTMRLIDGEPFKNAILAFHKRAAAGQDADARAAGLRVLLRRFLDVCNVIEYAHSRNVLHRDLKPSNVMLGPYGETLVVDWGLAKDMTRPAEDPAATAPAEAEAAEGPGLTAAAGSGSQTRDHPTLPGVALGTPHFMSPEQAAGRSDRTDRRTDVYGLGATLYYLLTAAPPCDGSDVPTILKRVRSGAVTPPRQARGWVPEALDSVCMKALAVDPARRYDSPRALAADVERWLADEPVSTHRDPASVRLTRWGRRHRVTSVALGVLLVSAVFGLTLGTVLLSQANRRTLHEKDRAEETARTLGRQVYINRVNLALRECLENNVAEAEALLGLCPAGSRGWEWSYVARLCHQERLTVTGHGDCVNAVAFSPDGKSVVSGSGKPFNRPRSGDRAGLILSDAATGREVRRFEGLAGAVHGLAFSRDGRHVASASGYYPYGKTPGEGRLRVWDTATGAVVFEHVVLDDNALCVAISPDGTRIAAGFGRYSSEAPGRLVVFDAAAGKVLFDRALPGGGVNALAFSPDGRTLAAGRRGTVEIWDVSKYEKLYGLTGHDGWVYSVAFHRDGKRLASGGWDRTVRVWDLVSRTETKRIDAHAGNVMAVAFSPDGTELVSTGDDSALKLWDPATGRELTTLRGHSSLTTGVPAVAFSPDGAWLASAGGDRTVKLWEVTRDRQVTFRGQKGWITGLRCLAGGSKVLSGSGDHTVAEWDAGTGRLLRKFGALDDWVLSLAVSPDGTLLASGGADPKVRIWDLATGTLLRVLEGHNVFVRGLAFSRDGRTLVSAGNNQNNPPLGEVFAWDLRGDGDRRPRPLISGAVPVGSVALGPDGKTLAVLVNGQTGPSPAPAPSKVIVFDWPSLRERFTAVDPAAPGKGHDASAGGISLAFSPVGHRLAVDGAGGTLLIYDTRDGRLERSIRAHTEEVASLVFSPDGLRLVSAGYDKLIRLWDTSTGEEVLSLRGHEGGVVSLAFSPDGLRLFSGSVDRTARVWDARPLTQAAAIPGG